MPMDYQNRKQSWREFLTPPNFLAKIFNKFFNMSKIVDNNFDVGPFKDRLKDYAEANYKSFREFEDKCGLTHAGLSAIGKQGLTLSYLAKIADACPELDMNWLIAGRKEPQRTESAPKIDIRNNHTVNIGNWGELVELVKSLKKP